MNSKWIYMMAVIVGIGSVSTLTPAQAQSEPPQCSDGIDNDGDGYTDFPDDPQCNDASDNVEAITGDRFSEAITIRYVRDTAFRGAAATNYEECSDQRRLRLHRRTRDGSRIIARTFTNGRGRWKVYWPEARGRYFAVAPEATVTDASGNTIVCERVASVTIRVRRT